MNLPNKLSILRMILVPIIVCIDLFCALPEVCTFMVNNEQIIFHGEDIIVFVLFVIASFTDFLDGNIARKNNLVTSFGKFIDPIADKMLVNSILILFACQSRIPVLALVIMIWRDTIVDGLRMSASSKGKVVAAGMLGKLKTVLQMIAIILVMLNNLPFAYMGIPMDQILIWCATIVSAISGFDYFMKLKDVVMETM